MLWFFVVPDVGLHLEQILLARQVWFSTRVVFLRAPSFQRRVVPVQLQRLIPRLLQR